MFWILAFVGVIITAITTTAWGINALTDEIAADDTSVPTVIFGIVAVTGVVGVMGVLFASLLTAI